MGCAEPSVSVLLIAPQDQQAWLVGPGHEAALDGVPLCAAHADRVTVPFGWHLHDDRPAAKPRRRRKSTTRKPKAVTTSDSSADADSPATGGDARTGSTPVEAASPAPSDGDETPVEAPTAEHAVVEPVAEAGSEALGDTDATLAAAPAARAEPDVSPRPPGGEVHAPRAPATTAAPAAATTEPPAGDPDRSPADVPVHADEVAAAVAGSGARLSVVPGEDDPTKTFTVEPDGQTSLWAETHRDDHDPSDETPLLKRAFRVVRED